MFASSKFIILQRKAECQDAEVSRKGEYKPFMIMSQYTPNENVPDVVYLSFYDSND